MPGGRREYLLTSVQYEIIVVRTRALPACDAGYRNRKSEKRIHSDFYLH